MWGFLFGMVSQESAKNNLYQFVVEIEFADLGNLFPSKQDLEENAFLRNMDSVLI